MKKLATLLTAIALTTSLAATGCRRSNSNEAVDKTPKPTDTVEDPSKKPVEKPDPAKADPAKADPAKTDPAKTEPAKTDPAAPAKAEGNLPTECNDYKAALDKLASCDKVPQATRDALKQSYDQSSSAWASVPAESKATVSTACTAGAKAVNDAAAAAGCK